MVRYLLDTNILSDAIKNPQGNVAKQMGILDKTSILTSIIVAAEMQYGIAKRKSSVLSERVNTLFKYLTIVSFDVDADYHYGQIRLSLERQGRVIGANDLLIAAHALSLDAVLVTDNVNEFDRISDLKVENWLRKEGIPNK